MDASELVSLTLQGGEGVTVENIQQSQNARSAEAESWGVSEDVALHSFVGAIGGAISGPRSGARMSNYPMLRGVCVGGCRSLTDRQVTEVGYRRRRKEAPTACRSFQPWSGWEGLRTRAATSKEATPCPR